MEAEIAAAAALGGGTAYWSAGVSNRSVGCRYRRRQRCRQPGLPFLFCVVVGEGRRICLRGAGKESYNPRVGDSGVADLLEHRHEAAALASRVRPLDHQVVKGAVVDQFHGLLPVTTLESAR